ncbi:uncharacterized protein LOC115045603 isoform X8 [Echeneis naucrates]|nr:uncharacterized protein LOC115045603 isoform X8 [Echeneis naucrates]XP_029361238.1 uncharacterized protein LOC115045603 isoform X8 [Echeneis naucrates]
MVGLFNVALGPGRTSTHPWDVGDLGAAYWLGGVYVAGGVTSILSGQCPSPCSVGFTVFVNIVGSIFATFGIVLYALDLSDTSIMWMCDRTRTSSPNNFGDCIDVAFFAQKLLVDMDVTLIVLAVLHLCVSISFAVLGVNALFSSKKEKILKQLCYSPGCFSVQNGLIRNNVAVALGVVQLMVGLFNVALGPGRTSTHPWDVGDLGAAYWLGGVYVAGGVTSILSGQCPSPCSVGFTVFVNVVGSIFATFGIVLYALDLSDTSITWMCDRTRTSSPNNFGDCIDVAFFAQKLLDDMDVTLIVLAVLHLCVSISFAVLGVNALFSSKKEKQKGATDVQTKEPLLKEILLTSPCA